VSFSVTDLPILLRSTAAETGTVIFASVAKLNPFASQLTWIPDWLKLGFYPIGFAFLLWVGTGFGVWKLVRDGEHELSWFLATALLAGAVIAESVAIVGWSQLFFLYMAMVLVAPVAGTGLCHFGMLLWRKRRRAMPIFIVVVLVLAFGLHLAVGGSPSPPLYDGSRWARSLMTIRIEPGVKAYRDPGPPSPPVESWMLGPRVLDVTPSIIDGLAWLRSAATPSTVIATDVPGAALYAALCECREYYQTEEYSGEVPESGLTYIPTTFFAGRERLLVAWMSGEPGSVAALRDVGITYLIVDHVNGVPVGAAGMPAPVYSNIDITIYKL
jgi:hypothetical protein